jgi:CubicO group peptidase (beta-lactamase class C family)
MVMTQVQGRVEAGFEPVRALFEQQFAQGQHIGAGVAVYHRGRPVVDLWGGLADEDSGRLWEEGTMAVSFSTTKGLSALCLHILADRGLVSYDDLVAKYWPEFAANGKEAVTVYHVLTHQAGVPQLSDGLRADTLTDWDRMVREIAALPPLWAPGTNTGYHAITFGYLVGEIVRRIDGRSVGAFFRDEVAKPLGIRELFIGAPADVEPKISTLKSRIEQNAAVAEQMRQFMGPESLAGRALGMNLQGNMNDMLNSPAGHRAEIPAVNGVMSARGLARMYACLAGYGELDGARIISEGTVRKMSAQQTHRPDAVIIVPVGWALGYMTGGDPGWPQGPRVTSFGHAGFGGSIGYADPEIGMSFGLVVNALTADLIGAGRTAALADAARACAEAR